VRRKVFFQAGGYLAGLATVALITYFYQHEGFFKTTTIVLTYLLAILIASTIWGLGVSLCMTVVSVLACDYYFFLPIGIFSIDDPQDWVALVSFFITSVIGSELSARARRQAEEAKRQRNEISRLYEFSQRLLNAQNPGELLKEIPLRIVELFGAQSAAVYFSGQDSIYPLKMELSQADVARLKEVQESGEFQTDMEGNLSYCPIRLGPRIVGSLCVTKATVSRQTIEAIASLIAAAMDRMHAVELLGKTEAARENERLKSVLLDAIAHDFKTPLTSIKAAATSLLEDLEFDKRQRGELLSVIDEECDRINLVIGQAIEMAQLDAGEAKLQPERLFVKELVTAALEDCASIQNERPIHTIIQAQDECVYCDLFWTRKVFGHLLRNANLYSTPGEPITITTERKDGFVLFHVADVGPGIEKTEIDLIFAKFYRGRGQRHRVPGTGMGLSVAKAIVEAHRGTLEVTSEAGKGSVFTFKLPMAAATNGAK
jgi:two-component system sensor histidine kinase KdpD